ncbi:DUF3667 domain-containing protein [Galbibacter mesophilus]|uniref:DUF3667 domain-containing protein n=1 Tax=Galbibacter mesophilus TaxID=379069 RepID=UPI00191E41B5|nr:DUF3667 domain-containing protein [Galbibacter mesophilus]MCM5663993.1 DUF3667 domain-containing protein [Galbibacter mesophilus]
MNKSDRTSKKYRGTQCLNCELPLDKSDAYCPNCGQVNSTKKLNIFDMLEEFFSSLFSYDSKLRKTLTALVLRPGKITREFVNGKRATYTNPFRFFLSVTIVYFLMIAYNSDLKDNSAIAREFANDSTHIENALIRLKRTGISAQDKLLIDSLILKYEPAKEIEALGSPQEFFKKSNEDILITRFQDKIEYFYEDIARDKYQNYNEAIEKLGIERTTEHRIAFNIALNFYRIYINPHLFIASLISKLPFIIFLFLPVFSIFIWLVYSKKDYHYIDHLIFSFHTQTFFTILLIAIFITKLIFKVDLHFLALLAFFIYLYKSMRGFYKQNRAKTIVKFTYVNCIFLILATVSTVLVIAIGVFTY